ncbi:hypothetical protein [Nocardia panacis]|uniref:hypothetical protein n=1 Tax=Nocardia panacis TaxID=2340916 RepID=UPI003F72078D
MIEWVETLDDDALVFKPARVGGYFVSCIYLLATGSTSAMVPICCEPSKACADCLTLPVHLETHPLRALVGRMRTFRADGVGGVLDQL